MEIWVVINLDRMAPGVFGSFSTKEEAEAYLASHGVTDWEREGDFIIDTIDTEKLDDGMRAG